ncbi:MAG: T9SS type A sorting domain-containing protein [Chitinophagales bacterium]
MSVKNSFIATCFLLSASVAAQVNTSFFLLYEDGLDIHFQVSNHTKMAHVQAASYTYSNDDDIWYSFQALDPSTSHDFVLECGLTYDTLIVDFEDSVRWRSPSNKMLFALNRWMTDGQNHSLGEWAIQAKHDKDVSESEVLSLLQQLSEYSYIYNRHSTYEESVRDVVDHLALMTTYNETTSPCACIQLNHFADLAPRSSSRGWPLLDGYTFLDPPDFRFAEAHPQYYRYTTQSPKFHEWYRYALGPAKKISLHLYDRGGSNAVILSEREGNDYALANHAYLSFAYLCVNRNTGYLDDCKCSKRILVDYRYDTRHIAIAERLRPLAKVESVVEEYAMLLKSTPGDVQILDGRSARTETSCRGYFDFDFLMDIGELAIQTIGLVEGFQTSHGSSSGTLQNTLPDVTDALINVFDESPIRVEGDCERKDVRLGMLQSWFYDTLVPNTPVQYILASRSVVAGGGKRKWDIYAKSQSDFSLSGIIDQGYGDSLKTASCCNARLMNYSLASMDGPLAKSDLLGRINMLHNLSGPWENSNTTGYLQSVSLRSNRGFFTFGFNDSACAWSLPEPLKEGKTISDNFHETLGDSISDISLYMANQEVTVNQSIRLHPNPFSSELNLRYNHPEDIQRTLIVDFQGRVVLDHLGFLEAIDGSLWPSGMYTLIVQSKDGSAWVQHLVLKQ